MKMGCAVTLAGGKLSARAFVLELLPLLMTGDHFLRPGVEWNEVKGKTLYKNFLGAQMAYMEHSRTHLQLQPLLANYHYGEKCPCCVERTVSATPSHPPLLPLSLSVLCVVRTFRMRVEGMIQCLNV
jgi:hypothetical protein